jgi:N-acetylglutamate synthase-like GNAT family acetyltransferase
VAHTFYEFAQSYLPEKDRIWLAELDGEIMGTIAIIEHSKDEAQLRWFLVHPDVRGIGLGKNLFEQALDFCRKHQYHNIFLLTTSDQQTAIRMYAKAGFVKTAENPVELWGKKLMDQRYELDINHNSSIINNK